MSANSARTKSKLLSATGRSSISPPPIIRKRKRSTEEEQTAVKQIRNPAVACNASMIPLSANTTRIFAWNINGIASFLQTSIVGFFKKTDRSSPGGDSVVKHSLRSFLKRNHWPQVVNLQEVKINPSDQATIRAVKTAVNRDRNDLDDDSPEYDVRFCLPSDKFNARGFGRKVYGVATLLRKDFLEQEVTKCRAVTWDCEGRVLVTETRSKLAIFNIYAVNGTDNPYKDPKTGQVVGTRHDRKLAFHILLLEECRKLENAGWQVVLTGDMNISPQPIDGYPKIRTHPEQHVRNRADYNNKFLNDHNNDGLMAIDTFRYLHPDAKKYTWVSTNVPFLESCDRVDHILVSRSITVQSHAAAISEERPIEAETGTPTTKFSLLEADILMTPEDRGPSDHCPLYVTLLQH